MAEYKKGAETVEEYATYEKVHAGKERLKKFEKLTESQLRKQLRKAGLADGGKKQALIRRLVKARLEPLGWDSSDDDSDDDSDE